MAKAKKRAYGSEPATGELEPRVALDLHELSTLQADSVAADETEAAAFHRDAARHAARGLAGYDVRRAASAGLESRPPAADEDLGVLRIEVQLEGRLMAG